MSALTDSDEAANPASNNDSSISHSDAANSHSEATHARSNTRYDDTLNTAYRADNSASFSATKMFRGAFVRAKSNIGRPYEGLSEASETREQQSKRSKSVELSRKRDDRRLQRDRKIAFSSLDAAAHRSSDYEVQRVSQSLPTISPSKFQPNSSSVLSSDSEAAMLKVNIEAILDRLLKKADRHASSTSFSPLPENVCGLERYCLDRRSLTQSQLPREVIDRCYRNVYVHLRGLCDGLTEVASHLQSEAERNEFLTNTSSCFLRLLEFLSPQLFLSLLGDQIKTVNQEIERQQQPLLNLQEQLTQAISETKHEIHFYHIHESKREEHITRYRDHEDTLKSLRNELFEKEEALKAHENNVTVLKEAVERALEEASVNTRAKETAVEFSHEDVRVFMARHSVAVEAADEMRKELKDLLANIKKEQTLQQSFASQCARFEERELERLEQHYAEQKEARRLLSEAEKAIQDMTDKYTRARNETIAVENVLKDNETRFLQTQKQLQDIRRRHSRLAYFDKQAQRTVQGYKDCRMYVKAMLSGNAEALKDKADLVMQKTFLFGADFAWAKKEHDSYKTKCENIRDETAAAVSKPLQSKIEEKQKGVDAIQETIDLMKQQQQFEVDAIDAAAQKDAETAASHHEAANTKYQNLARLLSELKSTVEKDKSTAEGLIADTKHMQTENESMEVEILALKKKMQTLLATSEIELKSAKESWELSQKQFARRKLEVSEQSREVSNLRKVLHARMTKRVALKAKNIEYTDKLQKVDQGESDVLSDLKKEVAALNALLEEAEQSASTMAGDPPHRKHDDEEKGDRLANSTNNSNPDDVLFGRRSHRLSRSGSIDRMGMSFRSSDFAAGGGGDGSASAEGSPRSELGSSMRDTMRDSFKESMREMRESMRASMRESLRASRKRLPAVKD